MGKTKVLAIAAMLMAGLASLSSAPAEAASFAGTQTGPTEWTYTLTYDPLDNYAVCPAPGNVATITLSGLVGVVAATAPTSTDFEGSLDTTNLAWSPLVSGGGTLVTWTHLGPGTGNFGGSKHVFGFKVFTATPAVNGTVNVASDGFSLDVSVTGPCPVQPADDRDFTGTTNGPVTVDSDGDGIPNTSDNCPFTYNPDQVDLCGPDTAGTAQTLVVPTESKKPGEPLWVTATFINNTGAPILTIRPDCVNTNFAVSDNPGGNLLDPIMREKIYGIPNDLVTIAAGAQFSVTCDLTEMFDPSILTSNPDGSAATYTVEATYANYIVDREPTVSPVYNVWIGAVTSAPADVTIEGAAVQKITAQVSFSPSELALSGEPTIWVAIDFSGTGLDPNAIDLSTIRLNGTVPIITGSAVVVGNILTVRFNGALAVQSLGTVVAGTTVFVTVAGSNTARSLFFTAQGAVVLVSATGVRIDIKPGSFPNSINLSSNGVVPVAIFSTASFDATTVDPLSVTLAGAHVRLKGKGTPMASFQDVNGDGRLDLVVHVSTEALELTGTDTLAVLKGKTFAGTPIMGIDSIRVVP